MSYSRHTPLSITQNARTKILKPHCPWSLGRDNERVIGHFLYNSDQYIHFGRMWQCGFLIAKCVRLEIIDTLLTLTLIKSKQPSYIQTLYAMNHILLMDIQYCVCRNYHLHPGSKLPLNFWSTSIHIIWLWDDMSLSHSSAFGLQFLAHKSFHKFSVKRTLPPHAFPSSSFPSISMTYHKQFQISRPCAPGLWGKVCSWLYGYMQHNSHHSDRIVMGTVPSFSDLYDITHLNFVRIFRL